MPHTPSLELIQAVACPRCDSALDADLSCPACRLNFPVRDGVPWLVADPDATRFEWKNRWQMALKDLEQRQQTTRAALKATDSQAATRRLETLAEGYASTTPLAEAAAC